MRWTHTFIPTLKETPADAEITSHKLLLRAGLLRKLTGGLYTFLPLGVRALRKVERIVREEMDRAGAMEVLMPALQPPEIWQQSGRYQTAGEVLFKLHDRANREWLLGPTHEEVITTLVASEIGSYRQLPKMFYQIQTKFRDEIRPRFGLMRAKEFIMKDAYSFDASDEAAQASYQKMYDAYTRIFQRCGLKAFPVDADTGVMGGKFSHEFMVPADTGENEVVYCDACGYAANIDKAQSASGLLPEAGPASGTLAAQGASGILPEEKPAGDTLRAQLPEKFATPGVLTIEALTQPPYCVPAHQQIKTLVYLVESKMVLLLLRGDHQLNEAKLAGALSTGQFRAATADEIFAELGAHPGSLGAVGVKRLPMYADEVLRGARGMTTGANEDGFHLRHISLERDIAVKQWADLRLVRAGEACVNCGRPLKIRRAIEVGHVFKLGTKYSEALGALFLDASGKQQPAIMGCYGIGVTRTLQAVLEQCNDKDGIIWPLSVAPYAVCITPLNVAPASPVMALAEQIYAELVGRGVEVILDDRDERPGVKFKDSELIGFPLRIGIGEKSLVKGEVELKPRAGALIAIKPDQVVTAILELLRSTAG
jgi:prolyl-tRNA synthetase